MPVTKTLACALPPATKGCANGRDRGWTSPNNCTRYADSALRPWFVLFDGDATAYVTGGIDTAWYDANHYLLVMTDAQNVAPAVPAGDVEAARARVAQLAAAHASIASADWATMPAVVGTVLPRG